jgi:hypothetical protein
MAVIQLAPESGYVFAGKDAISVTVNGAKLDPKSLERTDDAMTIYKEFSVAEAQTVPTAPTNPFVDVFESDSFYDAVLWAYYAEPQITNGMDKTHFEPMTTATRAHIVTFIWRAMGCPEPTLTECPFEDIEEGDYFYKAVLWAYEKGIVKGTDETHFTPKQTCSTAHIATMLYRALGAGTDGWYEEAGEWATQKGFLKDMDLTVGTDVECPRCAIVTFLYRALAK